MIIKLEFTSSKFQHVVWRIIKECINNEAITSVAALQSAATSGSWASALLQNFDAANSYIIRTNAPNTSLTVAHYAGNTASTKRNFHFTLMQSVSTDTTKKYYNQIIGGAQIGSPAPYLNTESRRGVAITSGNILTNNMPPTNADGVDLDSGTPVGITDLSSTYPRSNSTTAGSQIYTIWVHVTDTCFAYCFNGTGLTTSGFPATSTIAYTVGQFSGVYLSSEYKPYDYFNTTANGMIPVITTGTNSTGDWPDSTMYTLRNPVQGGGYFSILTTLQANTTSWPLQPNTNSVQAYPITSSSLAVSHCISGRSAGHMSLVSTNAVTTANTISFALLISTTANNKVANSALTTPSYCMHPIGWEHHYFGYMGGDMTAKSNIFLFNGDYTPGDEYTVGGRTYVIWPMHDQLAATRVGISIPKE